MSRLHFLQLNKFNICFSYTLHTSKERGFLGYMIYMNGKANLTNTVKVHDHVEKDFERTGNAARSLMLVCSAASRRSMKRESRGAGISGLHRAHRTIDSINPKTSNPPWPMTCNSTQTHAKPPLKQQAVNRSALLSPSLPNLRRETSLDSSDAASTTTRIASDEVKTILSFAELRVRGSAGFAGDVFD